jgi:serine protease Do
LLVATVSAVCPAAPRAPEERSARDFEDAFARAAEAIAPSVVSITSTRTLQGPRLVPWPFDDFFGGQLPDFFQRMPRRKFKQHGLGSGVIVDERGHIMTNNHVVAGAEELRVHLNGDRSFDAEIVGTDPKTDLAVIKIDARRLQPAKLAERADVRVGRWVLAVGSPFGLDQTVTAGIISAKGREGIGVADYEDLIQTDAAINAGNSGGPLINLDGEVVGINTAILSRTGGNQGIGFAIPISMARKIMRSLIETGKVTRGWLGITIQDLTPDMAASFGYESTDGVLVNDVLDEGPAAEGGLKAGDIIVARNGSDVTNMSSFRNEIAATAPGTEVELEVWRDGQREKLRIELGRMPKQAARRGTPQPMENRLGPQLTDLTDELRERLGLAEDVEGAVVAALVPGSPAAEAGLRVGEVITHVQGERVTSAAEAERRLSQEDLARGVRLRVRGKDASRFVLLKAGQE